MIDEIALKDSSDIKKCDVNDYREIKPENGMTYSDAKQYWNTQFKENNFETKNEKIYYDDNGQKYREGDLLEPNISFEINGYTYETDELGRVISAGGKLQLKDHEGRNEMHDSRDVVARGKMDKNDDRGHLIADRFNGSGGMENLVSMDAKLNKGDYASLEKTLAEAKNDGADVEMKVEPVYCGDPNRPSEFRVSYSINGDKEVVTFKNGSGE